MKKRLRVAVIFGGTNTEHEVSLVSARSVLKALDPAKYHVLPIMISKDNRWLTSKHLTSGLNAITATHTTSQLVEAQPQIIAQTHLIDVVFPVLHGPYGEDGTIQGLLELMHVAYVGSGVLASALCMDKVVQKQLCQAAQLPIVNYLYTDNHNWNHNPIQFLDLCTQTLGYPCFVKPANQGSSIGTTKVKSAQSLETAINLALTLDTRVIIETAVNDAREIECSILGNHVPQASVLGEIIPSNEFYDYDAKYVDGKSTDHIPADLPPKTTKAIQQTAVKAFVILNCAGLARVDFLVEKGTDKFYLNELNAIPGFTSISMYPKLWQASGLSYIKLLDRLIELALERFHEKSQLNLSYKPTKNWHLE